MKKKCDYIELTINAPDFIKEIALAPRLSDNEYEQKRDELMLLTQGIPIIKSNLYKFDRIRLNLKNSPITLNGQLGAKDK